MSDGGTAKGGCLSDEIVMYGVIGIAVLVIIAAVIVWAVFTIISMMVQAAAQGDFRFIVSVAGGIVLMAGAYTGAGLWLRRTGRI